MFAKLQRIIEEVFLHLQVRLEGGSFRLEEVEVFGSEVALARQLDSFEVAVKLLQLLLECVELAVRSQYHPERTVALVSCARNQKNIVESSTPDSHKRG